MITRATFILIAWSMAAPLAAQSGATHIPLSGIVATPSGAKGLCAQYAWACQSARSASLAAVATLKTAREVNRRINKRVLQVDDSVQYSVKDHWALPTKRGGDCEDFALLKKFELIQLGIPADKLLVATAFSRAIGAHAVLILRLDDGDHVLDNMTDQIKPWNRTQYTFLAVQNPDDPASWRRVSTKG